MTAGSGLGGASVGGLAGSSTGSSGSAGSGGGETYPATLQTFREFVFPQCTGGACHDLPEHPFYFKNDANLYAALTTHQSKDCGLPVITKGNPEQSALIKLLKGPCGTLGRMPLDKCQNEDPQDSDFCVRPPLVAALEQWIRNGAPEN